MIRFIASVGRRFCRSEKLLFLFIVVYIAIAYLAATAVGRSDSFSLFIYPKTMVDIGLPVAALLLCARYTFVMVRIRPARLFAYIAADLKEKVFSTERIIKSVPLAILLVLFISTFTSMKNLIPVFHEYNWDERFMVLDRMLHLGWHPWQFFEPALKQPLVTYLINVTYNTWFFVMLAVLFWQVFSLKNRFLRMRFLWVFVSAWVIGGNLMAIVFASTGPCFYSTFASGPNPYVPLMDYLNQANQHFDIWAIETQNALLSAHVDNRLGIGVGISAMPSMHVASATIFALVGLDTNRFLGCMLVAYGIMIYIGSIYLAWHYAVDGIAGGIFVLALWSFAGKMLRRDSTLITSDQTVRE